MFWAYLVKNPPLHYFNLNDLSVNLNDLNVRNYITMLDLVCTLITYLSIVIFFVYMAITIYIVYFCNDPIWSKAAKIGQNALKVAFMTGVVSYNAVHFQSSMVAANPTAITNLFDKHCFGGSGFAIEPGNLKLKAQLSLYGNQTALRSDLIAFLNGSELTDSNFEIFLLLHPHHSLPRISSII